jgi:hypothetical protein
LWLNIGIFAADRKRASGPFSWQQWGECRPDMLADEGRSSTPPTSAAVQVSGANDHLTDDAACGLSAANHVSCAKGTVLERTWGESLTE